MIPVVTEKFKVQSYEGDVNRRMKPVALQQRLQEAAYVGGDFCGAGYATLQGRGLFWALNRLHFKVYEWPVWGDELELQTWSRAHEGPLWHRNYRMLKDGKVIVDATSAWTLIDIASRSIWRGDSPFDESRHYAQDTLPFCSKIVIPRELPFSEAGSREALYSDLDTNGHVNNCIYPGWAIDALPLDYVLSHTLKDVQICYFREVHAGEEVSLQVARENDTWYILGIVNGAQAFVVRLEF